MPPRPSRRTISKRPRRRGAPAADRSTRVSSDSGLMDAEQSSAGLPGVPVRFSSSGYNLQQMAEPRTEASTAGLSGTFDSRGWQGEGSSPATVPALTVLFHPDFRRVGEWTALSELLLGREAQLSRTHPDFISPDRLPGGPLADRYISRRPVLLQPAPGKGVILSLGESRTRVDADGVPVLRSRELSAAELERGVVVELA